MKNKWAGYVSRTLSLLSTNKSSLELLWEWPRNVLLHSYKLHCCCFCVSILFGFSEPTQANSFNLWDKIQWMSLVIHPNYPLGTKVQFQEELLDVNGWPCDFCTTAHRLLLRAQRNCRSKPREEQCSFCNGWWVSPTRLFFRFLK